MAEQLRTPWHLKSRAYCSNAASWRGTQHDLTNLMVDQYAWMYDGFVNAIWRCAWKLPYSLSEHGSEFQGQQPYLACGQLLVDTTAMFCKLDNYTVLSSIHTFIGLAVTSCSWERENHFFKGKLTTRLTEIKNPLKNPLKNPSPDCAWPGLVLTFFVLSIHAKITLSNPLHTQIK